jgi:cytoskeletal protein CcmA (bactofilin family)
VRVLPSGSVRGSVKANEVEVEGTVTGDIVAAKRLRIAASGVVHGNVRTRRLEVEEGAAFLGRADVGRQAFPPRIREKKRGGRRRQ